MILPSDHVSPKLSVKCRFVLAAKVYVCCAGIQLVFATVLTVLGCSRQLLAVLYHPVVAVVRAMGSAERGISPFTAGFGVVLVGVAAYSLLAAAIAATCYRTTAATLAYGRYKLGSLCPVVPGGWDLLTFVFVLALLSAVLEIPRYRQGKEREVTRRIELLGGTVATAAGAVRHVDLRGRSVRTDDLTALRELVHLRSLDIGDTRIGDGAVTLLSELPALELLYLDGTDVTDRAFADLLRMPQLSSLNLGNTRVTDLGLRRLRGSLRITVLDISRTDVADYGMRHVSTLTNLRSLTLSGTSVSDVGVAQLCELRRLVYLDLSSCRITDASIVFLEQMPHIRTLYLDGTAITDAGLHSLATLPSLAVLGVSNTSVSGRGLSDFIARRRDVNVLGSVE